MPTSVEIKSTGITDMISTHVGINTAIFLSPIFSDLKLDTEPT